MVTRDIDINIRPMRSKELEKVIKIANEEIYRDAREE